MKKNTKQTKQEPVVVVETIVDVAETIEAETTLATELHFEEPVVEVIEDVPAVEVAVEVVEEPVAQPTIEGVVAKIDKMIEKSDAELKGEVLPAQLPAPPALVIVMPDVNEVEEFVNKLGVTTSYQVYTASAKAGLIAAQWLKPGTNFFERSYGERAGKKHLRNWAPLISLRTFIEIGLSYHVSKQTVSEVTKRVWQPFPNKLSYALLGMAVMTEREPAMSTGVYSNIGPSFKKHQQAAWTEWFHNNALFNTVKTEITAVPEPVVEPAVETSLQRDVETVETIAAELVEVVAKAKRGVRKNQEQAAA
jgi:hypothetical protein